MGVGVLILGESGTGKSTSLRNFNEGEIGVLNVAEKPLPFKKRLTLCNTSDYKMIKDTIKQSNLRAYAVDDAGYLLQFENFNRSSERGFDKFTEMAVHFKGLLDAVREADANTITYIMAHPQIGDNGKIQMKTIGKMLDNQLSIEGLFTVVLVSEKDEEGYHFITNGDVNSPAKSPMGMFDEAKIDNDLKLVDTTIREYWGLSPLSDKPQTPKPAPKKAEAKNE